MEQNCSRNSFPIARKSFARTGHKLLANQQRIFWFRMIIRIDERVSPADKAFGGA
jgi:hypothetical protein